MADDDGGEQQVCKVYDKNDWFTLFVQVLLAFFALASLYIKRMLEKPKRTFLTWFLDVSKQAFGACYAHVLNMIIAAIIVDNIRGESVLDDQCAWYGMSYLIDTTLGLVLAIAGLKILDSLAHENDWAHLKHSGVYTGETAMWHWVAQVLAWLFILTVVKIIIYFIMWGFSAPLAWIGGLLFAPIQGNIHFELVFVMILFPGLLNVIYFWIADGYLKAKKDQKDAHVDEDQVDFEVVDDDVAIDTPYVSMPNWTAFGSPFGGKQEADADSRPTMA